MRGTELSSHNNGKPLGRSVAQKIIDGFAQAGIMVSNLELGAPVAEADASGRTLLDLLQELRTTVDGQRKLIATQEGSLRRLQARVRTLERLPAASQSASGAG